MKMSEKETFNYDNAEITKRTRTEKLDRQRAIFFCWLNDGNKGKINAEQNVSSKCLLDRPNLKLTKAINETLLQNFNKELFFIRHILHSVPFSF